MKETAVLRRRILSRRASVAVVGQGHSGLSLSCAAAEAGFRVTGLDEDETRINDLRRGVLSVPGVSEHAFRAGIASERIEFSPDLESIQKSNVVSICAAVPIHDQAANLAFLEEMSLRVGRYLRPGQLVIVESSVFPGGTDDLARPALEAGGLSASHDFLLACSPERIEPGNDEHGIQNTPRIVGGMTREATGVAALFYGQFVDKVIQVSSCRVTEMVKFLEDSFRHVNVGLVNEMAQFCNQQGIDVWEVIDAAAIKPFGFTPFQTGPGAVGNGFPVDRDPGNSKRPEGANNGLQLVEQARVINSEMPWYVASRIQHALNERGRDVKGARILALGVTNKPDVSDSVESPALSVMKHLKRSGARVSFHDPFVPEVVLNGDPLARGLLTERSVDSADCVAILTPHGAYDLDWIARHATLVFDARHAYGSDRRQNVVSL